MEKTIEYYCRITGLSGVELMQRGIKTSSYVKTVAAVCNNFALIWMVNALEKVREHAGYKQQAKKRFKDCVKLRDALEMRMKASSMFDLSYMPPEIRAKYSEGFTREDYFEFWCGLGALGYKRTKDAMERLRLVYYSSMVRVGRQNAEVMSYAMVAMMALEEACLMMELAVEDMAKWQNVPKSFLLKFYGVFALDKLRDMWKKAILALDSHVLEDPVEQDEREEMARGIDEVAKILNDSELFNDSAKEAIKAFDDIWKNKGVQLNLFKRFKKK